MFQIDPILIVTAVVSLSVGYTIGLATYRRGDRTHRGEKNSENSNPVVGTNIPPPSPPKGIAVEDLFRSNKSIVLEVELPDLPEKIRIPYTRLPELMRLVEEPSRTEHVQGETMSIGERIKNLSNEKLDTMSLGEHPDNPWLDIVSKISGLEFSGDGKRVYCPEHGWQPYIVTSDGRILCGYDYHTLFDPNKPARLPSINELKKLQHELKRINTEISELRNMAQMQPIQHESREQEPEEEQEYMEETEEAEEEYEEE